MEDDPDKMTFAEKLKKMENTLKSDSCRSPSIDKRRVAKRNNVRPVLPPKNYRHSAPVNTSSSSGAVIDRHGVKSSYLKETLGNNSAVMEADTTGQRLKKSNVIHKKNISPAKDSTARPMSSAMEADTIGQRLNESNGIHKNNISHIKDSIASTMSSVMEADTIGQRLNGSNVMHKNNISPAKDSTESTISSVVETDAKGQSLIGSDVLSKQNISHTKDSSEYTTMSPAMEIETKDQHLNESSVVPSLQKSTSKDNETSHRSGDQNKTDISYSANAPEHETKDSKSAYEKPGQDIDLLMIGKTGNGKSALGNTILQYKAFISEASTTSVTKEVACEVAEFDRRKIKVVDVPGVGDTDWTQADTAEFVSDKLADAIAINPRGYHAFLLVAKFGVRFTKEEIATIDYVKKMFGKDFVKRYCILVMTWGDQLEGKAKNSFEDWLNAQKGVLAELVKECNKRVLLFDNKTDDERKKRKQLLDLTLMVDALILENCRYTNEQFELARTERDAFILNSKKQVITEEAMVECNIILQHFKKEQERLKSDNDITNLKELLQRGNKLYDELVKKDKKSGVLGEVILHIHSIRNSISDEIRVNQKVAELEKRIVRENEKKLKEGIKQVSDKLIAQSIRLDEYKAAKFQQELENYKELQSQWNEERNLYREEFQKILVRTHQLEAQNRTLRKKDRELFATIKRKVVKNFQNRDKLRPEDNIHNGNNFLY